MQIYKDIKQLNDLIGGKTISHIGNEDNPENDTVIVFTDGTTLSFTCVGDDMSYIQIDFNN